MGSIAPIDVSYSRAPFITLLRIGTAEIDGSGRVTTALFFCLH